MADRGSEPVPCDPLPRPASEPPCRREPPATEAEQNNQRGDVEENNSRGGGGEQASPATVAVQGGPHEEVYSDQAAEGGREGEQGGVPHGCNHDDDDGYHTPTSPRHMIPTDLVCPPAPRKALPALRRRKRKAAGDGEFYRVVRIRPQFPLEVELVLCSVPLGSRTAENTEPLVDMLVKNSRNV